MPDLWNRGGRYVSSGSVVSPTTSRGGATRRSSLSLSTDRLRKKNRAGYRRKRGGNGRGYLRNSSAANRRSGDFFKGF